MIKSETKKNKIEHNEEILREIWNRIMIEIWSIILTSLTGGPGHPQPYVSCTKDQHAQLPIP